MTLRNGGYRADKQRRSIGQADLVEEKLSKGQKTYLLKHTPVSYTHLDVYKRQTSNYPLLINYKL